MALVAVVLLAVRRTWIGVAGMPRRSVFVFVAIGLIVAAHWVAFYTSIKISNASVAVACLGLGSIFAAIIEPIVMRRPHERLELLLGVLAVPGVVLIVGGVPLEMRLGIAAGVVAALLSAIFTTLNKRFASSGDPFAITFLEMTAGAVVLSVPAALSGLTLPTQMDAIWLVVLAVACTLLPFVMWIQSLKHVSAFSTLLILNLEPVYAILLAAVLFQEYEDLTPLFYGGTAIVLLTVVLQPQLRRLTYFKKVR
jgi:drug/metabolite transporter (DMT)-like permease|tara:strand:- start:995 stop:1753 length:759 start_codon:yes stop_codon:yes gene_type:complete